MNENLKDKDVLLLKVKNQSELFAATQNKEGKTEGIKPDSPDNPGLIKLDRGGNVLENFFQNYMRQVKNPTQFEFFKVPAEKLMEAFGNLQKAFQNPDTPENKKFIELHRVNPDIPKQTQTQSSEKSYAINPDLVQWDKLNNYGITRESLEKSGNLEKLLNYQKTDLMPVALKFDEETLRTDARFSLQKQDDGSFKPNIQMIRHKPDLERPYFGIKFTEDDKNNLLTTGNLGRVVDVEFKKGEKTPVLISLDKQTNTLATFHKEWVKVPDTYKGAKLDEEQKQKLINGEKVEIKGMISAKGKPFDGEVQFNADKRYFELIFNNNQKQTENQKQDTGQNETKEVRIPKNILGVNLTEKQRGDLKAGEHIYVSGMKDKEGQDFNAYIKVNAEKNKLDFFKFNPDKAKKQGAEVTPDNAHKTQVAKNNNGNTTEATKNVNEPMKSGQTQPTEKQAEKQEQKKSKGVKM